MSIPDVLLIQNILTAYRAPFFARLAASSRLQLTVAYDTNLAEEYDLKNLSAPPTISVKSVHNIYLARRPLILYQRGVISVISSGQFKVVIAAYNPRIISNVLACFLVRRHRIKFIWWGHGFGPQTSAATMRLRVWLAHRADALIFYETAQAERLIELGVPSDRVFVAHNAIDTEEIALLVLNNSLMERHRVLYIGRLIPAKKVDLLLRAFALALPNLDAACRLTIIGDGPERAGLEQMAEQLSILSRVDFVSEVFQQDRLAPFFNTAWVSVSPGYIGLSAIHSLAYGLPMLVARDEPHSPEIAALTEGINCEFFESNQPVSLARRIIDLRHTVAHWSAMSGAARQTIQARYSLTAMVKVFEDAVAYVCRSA